MYKIYLDFKFYLSENIKLLIAVYFQIFFIKNANMNFQIFFIKNANMMSSIRKGVEWLKDNHPLMKIKYLPPRIDSMEEEESPFSTTFTLCHNFG